MLAAKLMSENCSSSSSSDGSSDGSSGLDAHHQQCQVHQTHAARYTQTAAGASDVIRLPGTNESAHAEAALVVQAAAIARRQAIAVVALQSIHRMECTSS